MKKISILAIAFLGLVLALAGCAKEPSTSGNVVNGEKLIRIAVGTDEMTKGNYDVEDKKFVFHEGDKFGLTISDNILNEDGKTKDYILYNGPMEYVGLENGKFMFEGKVPEEVAEGNWAFLAYYPYTENIHGISWHQTDKVSGVVTPMHIIEYVAAPQMQTYVDYGWTGGPMACYDYGSLEDLELTFETVYNVIQIPIEIPEDSEMTGDEISINHIMIRNLYEIDQAISTMGAYFCRFSTLDPVGTIYSGGGHYNAYPNNTNPNIDPTHLNLTSEEGVVLKRGEGSKNFHIMITYNANFWRGLQVTVGTKENKIYQFKTKNFSESLGGTGNIWKFPTMKLMDDGIYSN